MGATDKGFPLEVQTQDLAKGLSLPTGNGAIPTPALQDSAMAKGQGLLYPILPSSRKSVLLTPRPCPTVGDGVCREPEDLSFESQVALSSHDVRKREIKK